MSFAADTQAGLRRFAAAQSLPRVRALHLPPDPPPGHPRGEFCALELDDGALGLSYVLLDDTLAALRRQDASLGLSGADPLALAAELAAPPGPRRALALAAVNALTSTLYRRAGFEPPASGDSLGALDPQPGEHVGMVGLFTPLVPRVLASGARLTVLELKPQLAGPREGYRVTLDGAELAGCDKVLATGTLLLNDTLDEVLAHCRAARRLALVGPSVGCLPDPLFGRGVTLLGGTWVTDAPAWLDALRSGRPGGATARKTALMPDDYPGLAALLARC